MVDFVFIAGTSFTRVRVIAKNIYFMNFVNGTWVIQEASKVLEHMSKTKATEDKKSDLLGKIDIMKEMIKKMKSQQEVEEYVVNELKSIGFKLTRIERPGFRPEIIKNKTEQKVGEIGE